VKSVQVYRGSITEGMVGDGGVSEETMPMLEVEQLFRHEYDLEIQETFEIARYTEVTRADFAFDAAAVDDPDAVLNDINVIVDNFNDPPDDLPPEGKAEWRSKTVVVTDIEREDE
jgi:hypothetical protein